MKSSTFPYQQGGNTDFYDPEIVQTLI